jgi:thiol-disulfide isomerase/thioredoxin
MYLRNAILFTIFLLIFNACETKKEEPFIVSQEQENEMITAQDKALHKEKSQTEQEADIQELQNPQHSNEFFILKDRNETLYTLTLAPKQIAFNHKQKEIVVLSFISNTCKPCLAQLPYLNDLYQSEEKDAFFAAILMQKTLSKEAINTFVQKENIAYFVASGSDNVPFASKVMQTLNLEENFPMPLTVIYLQGKYYTHYEGIVPIEMIAYDIEQAKHTLKQGK